jgi:hypothetical protein
MSMRATLAALCAWAGCCALAYVLQGPRELEETRAIGKRAQGARDVQTPARGFVLSMDNATGWEVTAALAAAFEIEEMQVVLGHAGNVSDLTQYGRHVMRHGRTDDLQIGNVNMLGCLEGHREVWARVEQDSYVFEHDAVAAKGALETVRQALRDVAHQPWSVLMLQRSSGSEQTHFFADGMQYTQVGKITRRCQDCVSYGTRGYIVRPDAARTLLAHYDPPTVQVDAYMSLLSAYSGEFRQVWTTVRAVDWIPQLSTVQDAIEILTLGPAPRVRK